MGRAGYRVGVVSADGGPTQWVKAPGDPRNIYIARMDWAGNSDELILELRDSLQMTVVIASQDPASILAVASSGIFLDEDLGTLTAKGAPRTWLADPPNPRVRAFLTRATDKELV